MQFPSCAQRRGPNACKTFTLPDDLQGVKKTLLDTMLVDASSGNFPPQPEASKNKCVALPMSFAGPYCRNSAVHCFETVKISTISCSVRYQFLIHESNGVPTWAIIIGYGNHQHTIPYPRPDPRAARETVRNRLEVSGNTSKRQLVN